MAFAEQHFINRTITNVNHGDQIILRKKGAKHTQRGVQPDLIKSVVMTPAMFEPAYALVLDGGDAFESFAMTHSTGVGQHTFLAEAALGGLSIDSELGSDQVEGEARFTGCISLARDVYVIF